MNFGRRAPFLVALAVLLAAALAGTIDRSAAESARAGAGPEAGRLVAFRSCAALLGYAKSQAAVYGSTTDGSATGKANVSSSGPGACVNGVTAP